jgi:hypothetical protein
VKFKYTSRDGTYESTAYSVADYYPPERVFLIGEIIAATNKHTDAPITVILTENGWREI